LVSLIAAVVAMRSASKAGQAEAEAARLRQLEERVAQKKYELYQPILKTMGDLLTPGRGAAATKDMESVLPEFMTFVSIWGSDEAVTAFFRFRSAASTQPPAAITVRLVADFLLAARKDLAGPDTSVTGLETIGMRINDIYKQPTYIDAFTLPFDELAKRHDWTPPWPRLERPR
jgi:hypothetical protein